MRLPIRMQREIVRLLVSTKASSRKLSLAVGCSRTTVQEMAKTFMNSGKSWDELESLDDDNWEAVLGTKSKHLQRRKPSPNWSEIHAELQKKDVTLLQLHREWREREPNGIGVSEFSRGYRQWLGRQRLSMRQRHLPGDKMFVDFCGRTVQITPFDGEAFQAAVFVAVLGASNYTFALAVRSQTIADWVRCIVAAFQFWGGVTNWIVSDNLKSAVLGRRGDEVVLNSTYQELIRHYDTAALPARPRRPKDKSKVEVGVQLVQRWILAALRNQTFRSLTDLNGAIQKLLHEFNNRAFKKLPGCRWTRFKELDERVLKPLPQTPYEYAVWRYDVLVAEDYHVEHERAFYSTPSHLAHSRVDLKITGTAVEIFHRRQRIATHLRSSQAGTISTNKEHLPVNHRRFLDSEPRALFRWAKSVGPHTEKLIHWHLVERRNVHHGLKTAHRFQQLCEYFGTVRFEEVCAYAIPLNIVELRSIKSILKSRADKYTHRADGFAHDTPSLHENLRGPQYYGGE